MSKNNNKNVTVERATFTKAEREYIKGIVHNFSLDKWTDQEIVNYLHSEKKIDLSRSAITKIRNQIEKQAEKWYMELRDSRYKYIAIYKERIDSLFSYQKKLNQIVDAYLRPGEIIYTDNIIRAIAELHRIELSLFSLYKQLPNAGLGEDSLNQNASSSLYSSPGCTCTTGGHDIVSDCKCRHCLTVWCPNTLKQDWCPNPDCSNGIKGCHFEPWDKYHKWIQCHTCAQWFKTQEIVNVHTCVPNPNPYPE
jgi:hypothetical protein